VARSGDAAVTVLLGVSSLSNDRRQEWHENRRRDQNSRYSMCFTKTVLRVCPDTLGRITKFSKHEPN